MTNSCEVIDNKTESVTIENDAVFDAPGQPPEIAKNAENVVDSKKATANNVEGNQKELIRVVLWTAPRSMSTAFERCMTMVPNTKILNEMYAGAFLLGPDRKMRWWPKLCPKESYKHCKSRFEADYSSYDFVFAKDFPLELYKRPEVIPKGYQHTFLIRHPLKVFKSLRATLCSSITIRALSLNAQIKRCFATDGFFFEDMWELYSYLRDHPDYPVPIIMDADDIIEDPEAMVKKYCDTIGLPFNPEILKWEKTELKDLPWEGPRFFHIANWMIGCYKNALNSTGFIRRKSKVSSDSKPKKSQSSKKNKSAGDSAKSTEEATEKGHTQITVKEAPNESAVDRTGTDEHLEGKGNIEKQNGVVVTMENNTTVTPAIHADPNYIPDPDLTGLNSDIRKAIQFTMPFYRKLYQHRVVLDKVSRI